MRPGRKKIKKQQFPDFPLKMYAASAAAACAAPSPMSVDAAVAGDGVCPGCRSSLARGTVATGPNAGRIFISCPNSQKGVRNACGRQFRWLVAQEGDYKPEFSDKYKCKKCGLFLKKGEVKKENENKGKIFWSCDSECEGSFMFDPSTPGAKVPSVKKAEHDALVAKHDALAAVVFMQGNRLAELEAKLAKLGIN